MGKITKLKRLETVFASKEPDRTPTINGWIACIENICKLADVTYEEYLKDPIKVSIEAYKRLDCDGLIGVFVPKSKDGYRNIDDQTYLKAEKGSSLEEDIEKIDKMDSPEKYEEKFDFDKEYEKFKTDLTKMQKLCGDMVFMPANWGAGAKVNWYTHFGYENFFLITGLYPKHIRKLLEIGGAMGRCRSRVIAKAVLEGIYPHAVLLGEDICTQRGPMVSPDFLEKYYIPQLKYAIEPLLEVGCRPVWHSDGDVRLLMDMLIDSGIEGFQGFQPECGMTLDLVIKKRTKEGKPLLIFGPLAVTTELPVCTPDEIKKKVWYAIEACKGNADLVLFTSNTLNPDIPVENIIAMHEAVKEI